MIFFARDGRMEIIMFGYVNISQGSISEADKKLYSAYYCGLCKKIGEKSQLFRFTLSNDLTFLAVLLSAVLKDEPTITDNLHCMAHPVKKHYEVQKSKALSYAADMNILLVYLKICDDEADDGKLSDKLKKLIFLHKAKAVEKKYFCESEKIKSELARLLALEKAKSPSIDETADCFAKLLEAIFAPIELGFDDETLSVLKWIGYNIGRWIYIIDAYADYEKDKKSGSYNPFIYGRLDKAEVSEGLYHTLAAVANAYELLTVYRSDSLIRNIIFSGLPERQESVLNGNNNKK